MHSPQSLGSLNDFDSASVVPLLWDSTILLDHLFLLSILCMPGPDSALAPDKIQIKLLLGSMPSRVAVCMSFDVQQGTAGYSTSSGFQLFSETVC